MSVWPKPPRNGKRFVRRNIHVMGPLCAEHRMPQVTCATWGGHA